jgi:RNA polymerase sigma-70 factor (ECF subfamily)
METAMSSDSSETRALIRRVEGGDERALSELFAGYRDRLKRMVKLRMERRLQGRLDASHILQEAFLDVARRAGEYRDDPKIPVFLWLRLITGQRLMALHPARMVVGPPPPRETGGGRTNRARFISGT